ncbi:MAG TPA: YfiR family protein [Bryobacteraceae bacterium]|jgi:hypothetical protein|nr:YfiR family protein [Bryobacteraceae bacterium]
MRLLSRQLLPLVLACVQLAPAGAAEALSEYQVKAAFLYNFVKFVEWPATVAEQRGSIVMCVIGKDPFGDALTNVVEGKKVNGRGIEIRKITEVAAAASCHVLFISGSENARLPEITKAVRVWSVLTVGEYPKFTQQGGIVNFLMDGHRVRFQINARAAVDAGLKISSKLMELSVPDSKGKS